ncbi:MAG: CDP-alcohol phosphatidyltransferase family protein [Anaerolineales bacterium]|nr:CDP-alcohol phosphatidyltransferase family protein [Anaerolineales bacterium]
MTTTVISKPLPTPLRVAAAYSVHLFTATGAVWGMLALFAVFEGDYKAMILWMIAAMLVDGLDGGLARWADVKTYANNVDGALLDNILDYLNYVLVPAAFLIKADLLPDSVKWFTACLILLTSAYQFTQSDAKTDDHHFKGFPSYWNVAALYMLLMNLPPWVNFGFLMLFNVMVFIPVKYIYPSRNTYLRTVTLALTWLYGIIGIWALLQYPDHPGWVVWASFVYVAYYLVLSLIPKHTAHAN